MEIKRRRRKEEKGGKWFEHKTREGFNFNLRGRMKETTVR